MILVELLYICESTYTFHSYRLTLTQAHLRYLFLGHVLLRYFIL